METVINQPLATFYAYDQEMVRQYAHLLDYIGFIAEMKERLRAYEKYGHAFTSADDAVEKIRNEFLSLLTDSCLPDV